MGPRRNSGKPNMSRMQSKDPLNESLAYKPPQNKPPQDKPPQDKPPQDKPPQDRPSRRKITILPTARQFAVVRMDPISMVSHLNLDCVAIEEATAMRPKKYLVYLDAPQDLPLPGSQWCRYWVQPIATTLRPAVPEEGITSDMVLPVHPNTQHAKGRQAMACTPQFPFPHCYFWIRSMMSLRVRTKRGADVYDNDKAMTVSIDSHVAFMSAWNEDSRRMYARRREASRRYSAPHSPNAIQGTARHAASPAAPSIPPTLREYTESASSELSDEDSDGSDSTPSDGGAGFAPAPTLPPIPPLLELAIDTDVFGWAADPKVPFIPLVDLWFELEDHLSFETIPSPTELWREQETIGTIIEAALKRRAAATAPPQAPPTPRGVHSSPPEPTLDLRDSAHQDAATHHRLDLTSLPQRERPPARARLESISSLPKPDSSESAKEQVQARVTPPPTFASLFQSVAPPGNRIASWGFRSPLKSSQPSSPAPTTGLWTQSPASRPLAERAKAFRDKTTVAPTQSRKPSRERTTLK